MKPTLLAAILVSSAIIFTACGSDTPSPLPSTPIVVATPTPAPTPTPLGNAPVRVTARAFGYVRNEGSQTGRFPIPPAPAYFQIGDWIDLDCTPRDADNRETSNHPPFAEWYPSSGGEGVLTENYDYTFEDGDSYNPQIQLRYLTRTGFINVYCKIPNTNIVSNTIRIDVRAIVQ